MKKFLLPIIIVVVLLIAGGGYYFYTTKIVKHTPPAPWNAHSYALDPVLTLPDYLLSANQGADIVKMTLSLKFDNVADMERFEGFSSTTDTASASNTALSPLEAKTNALVSDFMMTEGDDILKSNKYLLGSAIKTYLDENLNMGKTFILNVYVGNYVIQ